MNTKVGLTLTVTDPFWVEVRESIEKTAHQLGFEIIPLNAVPLHTLPPARQAEAFDELVAQDLVGLIDLGLPQELLLLLAMRGLHIISLRDREFSHPNLHCPVGLQEAGEILGQLLLERLTPPSQILVVGGTTVIETRMKGLFHILGSQTGFHAHTVLRTWQYEGACQAVRESGLHFERPLDAVIGLSDPLAFAGRDTAQELGWLGPQTLVAGINGDPLALAAIAEGTMTATVETNATDFGHTAVTILWELVHHKQAITPYHYHPRLITRENVHEVAFRKLIQIAEIPNHLAGANIRQERQRLQHLETSLALHRQVGTILDRHQLLEQTKTVLHANLNYDAVHYYFWHAGEQRLYDEHQTNALYDPDDASPAYEAIRQDQVVFIPDAANSVRFPPDMRFPQTISRVVVPIHLGAQITGLLDLHNHRPRAHSLEELRGLQVLANQLGITLQNADLYGQAREAQARAEQADRLKTRLLANVSHELRTPLNLILGYSQAVLRDPNPYGQELPDDLLRDISRVFSSGEHLVRLINDLLDLSRAEVDMLDLYPEVIEPRSFLAEIFHSFQVGSHAAPGVEWILDLPEILPAVQADPLRLRQICMNLLSNAAKFTRKGLIVFGAESSPPHLHIWVEDSGPGIAPEMQEQIFEPFTTAGRELGVEGIGLGLTITRRLVALHFGSMALESQPGQGSTFHVYLPLPSLVGMSRLNLSAEQPVMVVIGSGGQAWPAIQDICARKGLQVEPVQTNAGLQDLLANGRPTGIAWNASQASAQDWQVIESVRANPALAMLPFLMFGSGPHAGEEHSRSGVTGILHKPVTSSKLIDLIRSLRLDDRAGPILVVDDEPETRRYHQGVIREALPGIRVMECDGGYAALAAVEQVQPSLILLDLMMPDLDGFSVLRAIRSRESTHRIPVLILSGKMLSNDEIAQLDDAYTVFQSKNILTKDELAGQIQRLINGEERLPQQTSQLVRQAVVYLQANYSQPLSRDDIAGHIGVNKDYLSRIFTQELGISTWDFLTRLRVNQAAALLADQKKSITEIAYRVGFNDSAYFCRVFQKQMGCSPREYRKKHVTGQENP